MWYVKLKNATDIGIKCLRFILTMWYVKINWRDKWIEFYKGFILTMWYVKNLKIEVNNIILEVLY